MKGMLHPYWPMLRKALSLSWFFCKVIELYLKRRFNKNEKLW